jgi:hypothetical protein
MGFFDSVGSILDPGNIFGQREGGMSYGNMMDPGAVIGGALFGEDIGDMMRQIADPGGLLGDINPEVLQGAQMEDYIRAITPLAMEALKTGTGGAVTREQEALQQALTGLSPYAGTEAFEEISALTGAMGGEAQQQAIQGIPLTDAQRAMQEREQRQLMRQANMMGRAGGGATVQELIGLGGRQQAETVGRRLQELQPLADMGRQTASVMSGLQEASLTRQAQLEALLGPQLAATLLGQVGPITETRQSAAELQGLQGMQQSQMISDLMGQTANYMGQYGG